MSRSDWNQAASISRRGFLSAGGALGLGALGMADITGVGRAGGVLPPHFRPRAKRVISLFMSGGPSHIDLFDPKPTLRERNGEELPESVRRGQRLTGMSGNQSSLPLAGSVFDFARAGESGAWISELLPYTAGVADHLCILRGMHTEAINHDPAITFFQTGSQIAGRPSIGAWMDYGLGSANRDLPSYVVLVTKDKGGQPLYSRLWGNGFLPSEHQGVPFRAGNDAVLYLSDPAGVTRGRRRRMLDAMAELHRAQRERTGDEEVLGRMAQAELAFRMQASVPEVTDVSDEPDSVFELYGEDARKPGTFAANCLLARRLAERDVRFIQLFHQGWDHHGGLPGGIRKQCKETDQASAALVRDLDRRGLLDDTLVVWGGEFGRTSYSQGPLTATNYGRDHHPRCFSMWLAGGGIRAGMTYGETDDFGYNLVGGGVHVHDLNALILHLCGMDHERLTYRHQGRRFRLTDVEGVIPPGLIG